MRQVPAKVVCDPSVELEFVYTLETTKRPLITVSHASGDSSEEGCLTLTKLYDWLATEPVDVPTVSAQQRGCHFLLLRGDDLLLREGGCRLHLVKNMISREGERFFPSCFPIKGQKRRGLSVIPNVKSQSVLVPHSVCGCRKRFAL